VLTGSYSGRFTVRSGEEAAERLLRADGGGPLPDAIVCANDQMAIGVLRTLAARRIRVPEDIAVVGFDDIFPASLCDPPLTTVHQPMRKIGERACDRLIERIADPSLRPKVELLPAELVLRSSCGCPPGTVARHTVALQRPPAPQRPQKSTTPKPQRTTSEPKGTICEPEGTISDPRKRER
jgi:LacI family transcriptional regulator